MIWIYRILFPLALLVSLPHYLRRMLRRGGYRRDFGQRFGQMRPLHPKNPEVKRVWIQAVSVGELLAIGPLLKKLAKENDLEVYLTTTTSTGRILAEENYKDLVMGIGIFPIDWFPFSRSAWRKIAPDLIVLVDSELWPEHLHQSAAHKVPSILINARMSDRSARRFEKLRPLAARLMRPLTSILAASGQDFERFLTVGLPRTEITKAGNLKFDVDLKPLLDDSEKSGLRGQMGISERETLLLGSSTWPGEEAMIVKTLLKAKEQGYAVKAVIVPRHAERKAEVSRDINKLTHEVHFYSDGVRARPNTEVYVADTTGMLRQITQVADLVYVGKSMTPHTEGQTPIEAAGYDKPILFGPGMKNFKEVAENLTKRGLARVVRTPEEFEETVIQFLECESSVFPAPESPASKWLEESRGATDRALDAIRKTLKSVHRN